MSDPCRGKNMQHAMLARLRQALSLEPVSLSAYDGAPRRDKWEIPDQLFLATEEALLQEVRGIYKGAVVSGRDSGVY